MNICQCGAIYGHRQGQPLLCDACHDRLNAAVWWTTPRAQALDKLEDLVRLGAGLESASNFLRNAAELVALAQSAAVRDLLADLRSQAYDQRIAALHAIKPKEFKP